VSSTTIASASSRTRCRRSTEPRLRRGKPEQSRGDDDCRDGGAEDARPGRQADRAPDRFAAAVEKRSATSGTTTPSDQRPSGVSSVISISTRCRARRPGSARSLAARRWFLPAAASVGADPLPRCSIS
jgi:hypothetical protein